MIRLKSNREIFGNKIDNNHVVYVGTIHIIICKEGEMVDISRDTISIEVDLVAENAVSRRITREEAQERQNLTKIVHFTLPVEKDTIDTIASSCSRFSKRDQMKANLV